ncbi:MAG: (Fe-S)-binding protein [Chitinophagaceae bacterium]|jgi:heterodisulfide reductase subunit C|nr:(Fe-S)-binding protein [Chitinophagaceae bacterium]MBK7679385.1 (Fe-S)-binding protein [Chitinophagaceae bacterium]MBK9463322.1 (Fe-S)-binding protein [Chitinophagaceae bacterium]MBK9659549.1 (Fe-S)-binding protein [Chitinophagaceae bacterium]MBK9936915.1 (Fe-S)-binding protein [Chitinophagaceae bacterium]
MQLAQQILFIFLSAVSIWLFTKKVKEISRNIKLGRDEDISDNKPQRWKNLLLLAFGQKKMFRNPLVAVLHFFVYAGFVIINIEVLEIVLDGIFGTHRMFSPVLGGFYTFLINSFEVLALLVLVSVIIFLIRRNIIKLKRFVSKDLDGWPRSDANYILLIEIVLMSLFLFLNASDTLLQARGVEHYAAHPTGNFIISQYLHPLLNGIGNEGLQIIERGCWWLHIVGIFAFLNYLPYSKHLHIVLAFPNAWYANLQPMGKMENMESIQKEVLYAMQPELIPAGEQAAPQKFGAKDIMDLSWKNLMDAYSCTECGRCSAACPANQTGKLLSPRKIMMDTRDRMEVVGKNINTNKEFKDDGKSLLHDYISVEELRACTTCNACVQECPVSINPLDIILELRRYLVMEESNSPQEWAGMFSNVENNFAPWKFSPDERDKWVEEV